VKQGLIPPPAGQTLAGIYQRSDMPRDHGQPKGQNSPLRELLRDNDILGLPQWSQDSPIAGSVASHIPRIPFTMRKKEPTSGLKPLSCSLRVCGQWLLRVAQACKTRICKRFFVL
jgi:hypothetical protein